MSEWNPDKTSVDIARDLRLVEQMYAELPTEALATFNDREHMPGGTALNMMAAGTEPRTWQETYDLNEEAWSRNRRTDHASDQVEEESHPLNILEFWTRVIREVREQPTGLKATISREADYLRNNITWMTRPNQHGEPAWPEVLLLADELRTLVRNMEDVLRFGSRLNRGAAACFRFVSPLTEKRCGGELVRVNLKRRECKHAEMARQAATHWGEPGFTTAQLMNYLNRWMPAEAQAHRQCDQGGRDDIYRCQSCEKRYTETEYWLCVRENYEKQAG